MLGERDLPSIASGVFADRLFADLPRCVTIPRVNSMTLHEKNCTATGHEKCARRRNESR